MSTSSRKSPLLVFDGDCSFCRLWIERWKQITGDKIAYKPYQEVASQFPDIPIEEFQRSVQLITPNGERFKGAEAVFRTLELVPGKRWMFWVYEHIPGTAFLSESFYRFVAKHRSGLYTLTRFFWDK